MSVSSTEPEEDENCLAAADYPLSIPLSEIELSVRSANVLKNAGMVYLGDLRTWTEADLLRLQNCGRKSVQEIKDVLAGFGLNLGNSSGWTAHGTPPSKTLTDYDELSRAKFLLKVDELDLSSRGHNVAVSAGIEFVGELVMKTAAELVRFPNCGRTTAKEIQNKLESLGLSFGIEIPGWDRQTAKTERAKIGTALDMARAAARGVDLVKASFLEDELLGILRALAGDRNAEIAAKFLGWAGNGKRTLDSVGQEYRITRERVRQITAKAAARIGRNFFETPILLRAVKAVQQVGPATSEELAMLLRQAGITRGNFNPSGLATACETFNIEFGLKTCVFAGIQIYGERSALDRLRSLHLLCRRLTSARGCANFDAMCDEIGIYGRDREGARALIVKTRSNIWLGDDRRWIFAKNVSRNRLTNIISKVLFVSPRVHLSELRRATAKSRRLQTAPPAKVLASFLEANGLAVVSGDNVISARTFDNALEAGSMEETMVRILRAHGPALPWDKLQDYCIAEGMNPVTATIYMSISPVVMRAARGVYALIGSRIEPGVAEEISAQMAKTRRPSEFGWTSRNTLWCAISVNRNTLTNGSITFPSFVASMVEGKEWRIRFDNRFFGTVLKVRNNFAWSLAKPLSDIGADPGDICILDFDLTALTVDLAVGGEDLVDAWESGDIELLEGSAVDADIGEIEDGANVDLLLEGSQD